MASKGEEFLKRKKEHVLLPNKNENFWLTQSHMGLDVALLAQDRRVCNCNAIQNPAFASAHFLVVSSCDRTMSVVNV